MDPRTHFPAHIAQYGVVSYLGLPVKTHEQLVGVLVFNTPVPLEFPPDEIAFLGAFAQHAALALHNAHLHQVTQQELTERAQAEARLAVRTRQLETIQVVTAEITRELDLPTQLRLIITRAVGLVEAAAGVIYLWDAGQQLLIPHAWQAHGEWMKDLHLRLGEGVTGVAAERRAGIVVNEYGTSAHALPLLLERVGVTASLAEPLLFRDRLLGVLVVNHIGAPHAFTEPDQDLLRLFAAQAAIAIENARLHATVQQHAAELEGRVQERTAALEVALRVKTEFLARSRKFLSSARQASAPGCYSHCRPNTDTSAVDIRFVARNHRNNIFQSERSSTGSASSTGRVFTKSSASWFPTKRKPLSKDEADALGKFHEQDTPGHTVMLKEMQDGDTTPK